MAKIKVAIVGTVGKVVSFDPDAGATIERNLFMPDGSRANAVKLRAYLGLGSSGSGDHHELTNLGLDDHPQYTGWAHNERITGQWQFTKAIWAADGTALLPSYTYTSDPNTGRYRVGADNEGVATGGVLRWDVDTTRVHQSLPLHIDHTVQGTDAVSFRITRLGQNPGVPPGGFEIQLLDTVSPGDDTGVQMGLWESGSLAGVFPPQAAGAGYRWRMAGDDNSAADMVFYSHENTAAGTEIYRHRRNRTQMFFVSGAVGTPTISIGGDDTGIYSPASNQVNIATNGTARVNVTTAVVAVTLPVRGANGTAAAPEYSFTSATGVGMYTDATNLLFATAGTLRLTLGTTAIVSTLPWRGPDGTNTAPAWSFSSSTGDGAYLSGTNTVSVATNGTLRFSISTTAITSTLPFVSPTGTATPGLTFTGDLNSGLGQGGADIVYLVTGGTTRFGVGAAGEILDASGSAGSTGQVPTSGGSGAAWAWGTGGGSGGSLVYANTSVPGGNTVANTAADTAFTSSYTIPVNQIQDGTVIRVKALGVFGTDAVAPTLRIRVKLGSATVLDTGAQTVTGSLTNQGWTLDGQMICFTDGASGTLDAQGLVELATGATDGQLLNMENTSTIAIDTTATQALTVTVEWGTADTDNTITLRELAIHMENSVSPTAMAPADATYLTSTNQTASLPNSRHLKAGTNIAFDDTVSGERTVNADSAMTFVGSAAVAGAAATDLTISGLDLSADERYFIVLNILGAGASFNVSMYFNGDTTAANYERMAVTDGAGAAGDDALVAGVDGTGFTNAQGYLELSVNGRAMWTGASTRFNSPAIRRQDFSVIWDTAANVTSITINASVASTLAIGTSIKIWRIKV